MNLRQKIILFAITPLFLALGAIAFAVRHQANLLAAQQRAAVEQAYLASKEAALKHYLTLGMRSIARLYESGRNDEETRNLAKLILKKMDWGDDDYFYIYDLTGVNLMHPRQADLVGRDLWELRDSKGEPTIQKLIARARAGGANNFSSKFWIFYECGARAGFFYRTVRTAHVDIESIETKLPHKLGRFKHFLRPT